MICFGFSHAHKNTCMSLKWNRHNGNWLISASRDHFCKLFDIRNLKEEVQCFRGHKKEACSKLSFFVLHYLQIKIAHPHHHACICLGVCLFLHEIKVSLSPIHVNKTGNDKEIITRNVLVWITVFRCFSFIQINQSLLCFIAIEQRLNEFSFSLALAWHPIHERLFSSGGSDGSIYFWHVG